MSKTTILIRTTTREKLRHIGRKNQTYDQLINQLIKRKEKSDDLLDGRFAVLPSSESGSQEIVSYMNTVKLSESNTNKAICEAVGCDAEATSEVALRLGSNERISLFVCEKCKPRFLPPVTKAIDSWRNDQVCKKKDNGSKFYRKSLTLLVQILKMIDEDIKASDIARKLNLAKQHLSYYVRKLKGRGYVQEITRDRFKVLQVTQAGKNFVAMYENSSSYHTSICRAENIRFKAEIIRMPSITVDWHKVEMHNWDKYNNTIDGIKVHINLGNQPTIEFIPGAIDGDNPDSLRIKLLQACTDVAVKLESILNMKIGRLELSSRGEWVVYDPFAHNYSKQFGQITIDGIGKVNASKPSRIGAFEFFDPRDCADYMAMPKRLSNLEQDVKKILALLKNEDTIETDHDSQ